MSELIFWDTSAFVALSNQRDDWHQKAIQINHTLAKHGNSVLTTNAVLTEVANTFSKIGLRPTAQRIIQSVEQSVLLEVATIVHITPSLWQQGWQLFTTRTDKEWGLTDCLSFVVMEAYQVTTAFTTDHHFEQAGFIRLIT